MSTLTISTPFQIDLEFEAAPFHRRLFAWLIDFTIQLFYLVMAIKFLRWLELRLPSTENMLYNIWAVSLLLMLPFFLYHVVAEVTLNGQSLGKKLMGIRVMNEKGGKSSLSQFIIRWLIKTSDYTSLLILLYAPFAIYSGVAVYWAIIGSLCLLFFDIFLTISSKKGQRLGDILAHTIVVKVIQKASIKDTIYLNVEKGYSPAYPEVIGLDDKDIRSIKLVLDASHKKQDHILAVKTSDRIKDLLQIESTLPPVDFLYQLLKDYNYLVSE